MHLLHCVEEPHHLFPAADFGIPDLTNLSDYLQVEKRIETYKREMLPFVRVLEGGVMFLANCCFHFHVRLKTSPSFRMFRLVKLAKLFVIMSRKKKLTKF